MDASYLVTLEDELQYLRKRKHGMTGAKNRAYLQRLIDQVLLDIATEIDREFREKEGD